MANYKFLKPYQFQNGAKLNNRVVMTPLTNKFNFYDGAVSNDEINYYRSQSGPGMVITATLRAIKAGFDGVEIHGVNHYLV